MKLTGWTRVRRFSTVRLLHAKELRVFSRTAVEQIQSRSVLVLEFPRYPDDYVGFEFCGAYVSNCPRWLMVGGTQLVLDDYVGRLLPNSRAKISKENLPRWPRLPLPRICPRHCRAPICFREPRRKVTSSLGHISRRSTRSIFAKSAMDLLPSPYQLKVFRYIPGDSFRASWGRIRNSCGKGRGQRERDQGQCVPFRHRHLLRRARS